MTTDIDYSSHNEEVRQVWDAYWKGAPIRVPVGSFTIGPRIWVLDPRLNTDGITWERFSTDPDVMFDTVLKYKHHLHHHVVHDIEMGVPEAGWDIGVEFANIYEAAWLGCDILYPTGQISATRPRYAGDCGNEIFEEGLPDPASGLMGRVWEYYEHFVKRARNFAFHGKPVKVGPPGPLIGTDGPLTVALDIRGDEIFSDMLADPDYYHRLMDFITTATIRRITAWRTRLGLPERPACGGFADDAIQMISTGTYQELVLPYHRRLLSALFGSGPHWMHICGNVQRHFPTLIRELNIGSFDTGFPIRFETLRDEIGEAIHVSGGMHVDILLRGTPADVARETRRILASGVTRGGRFIMKEANNMPPCTPLENIRAMYETVRQHGTFPAGSCPA